MDYHKRGNPVPNSGNFAVEEVETDCGPMDYGLIIDGVIMGDIEAKPEGTGVPGIIAQDKDTLGIIVRVSSILMDTIFPFSIPQMVI